MKKVFSAVLIAAASAAFLYLLLIGFGLWFVFLQSSGESHSAAARLIGYSESAVWFVLMLGLPALFVWSFSQEFPRPSWKTPLRVLFAAEVLVLAGLRMNLAPPKKFCESCDYVVGGLNLNLPADRMTIEERASRFGTGCAAGADAWTDAREYYFPKSGTAMLISDSRLRLFPAERLAPSCTARRELDSTGTSKGVLLGDPREKVLATYGPPTETDGSPPGESELIYRKPGNAMSFRIADGKVVAIELWGP